MEIAFSTNIFKKRGSLYSIHLEEYYINEQMQKPQFGWSDTEILLESPFRALAARRTLF